MPGCMLKSSALPAWAGRCCRGCLSTPVPDLLDLSTFDCAWGGRRRTGMSMHGLAPPCRHPEHMLGHAAHLMLASACLTIPQEALLGLPCCRH